MRDISLFDDFFDSMLGAWGSYSSRMPAVDVEEIIGHPVGGVCPFGVKDGVTVYLDQSLRRFDYVYPAAGSRNSAIKLTIPELEETSEYKSWVDVTKLPEGQGA